MVLKDVAWDIAQKAADDLPPYLKNEELTIVRFYEKNKGRMSRKDAREILERLVESGQLEKLERRRRGRGGSRVFVYAMKRRN